jgi:UPF0755 protein
VRVQIAKGAGPRTIAAELRRRGIAAPEWMVVVASRLRGDADRMKSGVYQVDVPLTLQALLDRFVKGDVLLKDIRFVEGWTFRQMRESIAQHPDLLHDSRDWSDRQLLDKLGMTEGAAEGLFFPSTYFFSPGSSDLDLYRQANRQLRRVLDDAWRNRRPDLPFATPYEALVMASIVEKETGREADRDKVAAVFVNRLRRGMMLQSDPTVIYGIGEAFDGNLRKRDLTKDSPYNTYVRTGLPPTPIALPGKSSIVAAVQPATSDALYFVARGDGSSEFSNDLPAHNRAVNRYQRGGRP